MCEFDLRDSDRIEVSADTLEIYFACLENRPLGDVQASLVVDTAKTRMERLNSALEYLSTICAMEEGKDKVILNPTISKAAHQWGSIGLKVEANPQRLSEVLIDIETQLVYAKTIPGRGVLQPEKVRNAICWGYLRDAAQSAHQSVIKLEQTGDINHIAEMRGIDPEAVLSTQLLVNKCISIDFRAAMRAQFIRLKRQRGENSELEARRVGALISLVQELRSVHETSWLKSVQAVGKVSLFVFIAAGALQPWAPVPFKNWHVLLSDVERVACSLSGQPFPTICNVELADRYVVKFSQIFSERAAPSDWLGLSSREIESRVEKLARASEYPINNSDAPQDGLALPLGFCAFLAGGAISICGDPEEEGGLEKLALVSDSREAAVHELTQACLRTQTNYARLAGWERVAATVAWNYASAIRDGRSAVEAWQRAKSELTEAGSFSHKAIRAAIEGHESSCGLQSS